jgi:hypothetical protein
MSSDAPQIAPVVPLTGIVDSLQSLEEVALSSFSIVSTPATVVVATVAAVALTTTVVLAPVVAATAATVTVVAAATMVAPGVPPEYTPQSAPSSLKCMETDDASLHRNEQTIASLLDPAYWESCCPWLHCCSTDINKDDLKDCKALSMNEEAHYTKELNEVGYFKVDGSVLNLPPHLVNALVKGILRLLELGHSASAISSYDEAWELQQYAAPMITRVTGNQVSGDIFSFHVTADKQSGFVGPHRDKPLAGNNTFREDGSPMYATCWICLTPATNTSSCLYFIPKKDDKGYHVAGDSLDVVLPHRLAWQNIIAEPCQPGDMLCFSHRVVHWASKARKRYEYSTGDVIAEPRIALSFAVTDYQYEQPNFVHDAASYPSIGLRVGLTAAQAILYNEQVPLKKHELALNNRIFCSSKHLFQEHYVDRVCGEAQYLKFKLKNSHIAKNIDQTREAHT